MSSSMSAVSETSWLVAPQCTKPAAEESIDRTRSVSALTSGILGVPARRDLRDNSPASNDAGVAAAAIDWAADAGIIPNRDSTLASATSNCSIACRIELSENNSASASVLARLSIKRDGMSGSAMGRTQTQGARSLEQHAYPYTSKNTVSPSPQRRISKRKSLGSSEPDRVIKV